MANRSSNRPVRYTFYCIFRFKIEFYIDGAILKIFSLGSFERVAHQCASQRRCSEFAWVEAETKKSPPHPHAISGFLFAIELVLGRKTPARKSLLLGDFFG